MCKFGFKILVYKIFELTLIRTVVGPECRERTERPKSMNFKFLKLIFQCA